MKRLCLAVSLILLVAVAATTARASLGPAVELLTAQEAARPNARTFGFTGTQRSDGPVITVQDIEVSDPQLSFRLAIDFAPTDGNPVDLATLHVECLKSPAVDLTAKVKPYTSAAGLLLEKVSLPPGVYRFRVGVGDVRGKLSEKEFTVNVSVLY